MKKVCTGFGHREVHEDIKHSLEFAINEAIEKGCTEFLCGDMGKFDRMFYGAVKIAKTKHRELKIICVMPYLTKKLQQYKDVYESEYDEIVIPEQSAAAHYKSAITKRNQWMIDNSDIVIIYAAHDYGGAYAAKQYAVKQAKEIIEIKKYTTINRNL
ncbi:MAG: DUF1273 family protein [Eubacterium sp.]|nr:DUF1273 family protein [Eubacterium sp.]